MTYAVKSACPFQTIQVKSLGSSLGVLSLIIGLNSQAIGVFSGSSTEGIAMIFYVLAAGILMSIAAMEAWRATDEKSRRYAFSLVVLEAFLIVSGFLFFWRELPGKDFARAAIILLAILCLGRLLKAVRPSLLDVFMDPLRFARIHWGWKSLTWTEAMILGFQYLAMAYAFMGSFPGKAAFVAGSFFLWVSSATRHREAQGRAQASLAKTFQFVNATCVVYAAFFLVAHVVA